MARGAGRVLSSLVAGFAVLPMVASATPVQAAQPGATLPVSESHVQVMNNVTGSRPGRAVGLPARAADPAALAAAKKRAERGHAPQPTPSSTPRTAIVCSSVTMSASPASPQQAGTLVTFTATATGCDTPTYEFWLLPPGGAWQVLQAYGASNSANWNTAGLLDGTYQLDVWVRESGSGADWEAHLSPNPSYTLGPPCTAVTLTSNPSGQSAPGMSVTFTAAAAGCPAPEYEFWLQPPGSAWQVLQAYSSSATATWNTTGLATGTYLLDVWARQSGAANQWEAHISPNPSYTLAAATPCSGDTLAFSPSSPQAPGPVVTLTATAAGCPNPTFEFWVQPPNSGWLLLQGWSSSAAASWNTAGAATGTYLFDVWARQSGSTAQYEAHISPNPSYLLSVGPPCTSVVLSSASPGSPQPPGTTVTFTAAASGCPSPTYEFWLQAPGGAWQVLQGWSSAASAIWSTTGLASGTYLLDIWARQNGSTAQYEAHLSPNPTYTLGPACSSVTMTAAPASPQLPGTSVTLSASASGCPQPTYEFWVQPPGGAWQVLQGWSSAASATWNTSGLATGTYLLDVWARESGSGAQYEAHLAPNPSYSLSYGPPCTAVSLQSSPVSPQMQGVTVTFTASASGCPQPQYEFWLQPPGGAWQMLQAYSGAASVTWNSTGQPVGTYLLDVWARQTGSPAQYEAHLSPNPAYTINPQPTCSAVTLAANPSGSAQTGTAVVFTAAATGCPNPTYEFWLQPPGGAWQILQAYSSSPSVTWNTAGLASGAYLLDVWVRQSGSAAQWEAHLSPNPSYRLSPGWHGLDAAGVSAADEGFCCVPPDTTGSIGPSNYVETINTTVAVYDRNLNLVGSLDLASFAGAGSLNVSDPQIQWDPRGQRWFYSLVAFTSNFSSTSLLFGWSTTADPTNLSAGWCRFGISTGTLLQDYPKLGHDDNFIAIGANEYDMSKSSQPFVTAQIWAVRKPSVGDASCTTPSAAFSFANANRPLKNADGSLAFTPVPANTADASTGDFIVAAHTPTLAPMGPQTKIMAWHLGLQGNGSPGLSADGDLAVASFDVPASVPQPGGPVLDSLDARLTQAVAHVDPNASGAEAVWTQHTINGPGGRSVVRWYELLPATHTVRQQGQVASATDFVFNGAISPSIAGSDAAVFYDRGGASEEPVVAGQGHGSAAALGTLDSGEVVLAASTSVDNDLSCSAPYGPPCRWGDYGGASPDPVNSGVVWGTDEVSGPTIFGFPGWGTYNFALAT
jgi:hypothetical protein